MENLRDMTIVENNYINVKWITYYDWGNAVLLSIDLIKIKER